MGEFIDRHWPNQAERVPRTTNFYVPVNNSEASAPITFIESPGIVARRLARNYPLVKAVNIGRRLMGYAEIGVKHEV